MIYINKPDLVKQRDLVAGVDWKKNGAMIDGLLYLLDLLIEDSEGQWIHTPDGEEDK